MSCEQLDQLRASSRAPSLTWPAAAQAHLKSCLRCSQLQAVLESAPEEDVSEALQAQIEAAILPGLSAVSPLPSAFRIATALILAGAIVTLLANWRLGVAGWHARSVLQLWAIFGLLVISLGTLAKTLAIRMMPGSRDTKPLLLYIAAPLVALLAADVFLFGYGWNPDFFPIAFSCWEVGIICATLSAPVFWMILRRGQWLNPVGQSAAAGLLAGLVGVAVLEIYCPYLDRLHIAAGHIGAAVTASLFGSAIGGITRISNRGARQADRQ